VRARFTAVLIGLLAAALVAVGSLAPAVAPAAQARTTISSHYLLRHLASASEHSAGYQRSAFRLWIDADDDGCDTRREVLLAEAVARPRVGAGCAFSGGRWFSKYDGRATRDSSAFDIDHMVPLNEAWQSGAYRWSAATRTAYANDLGYAASLVAVSAGANRSKSDRDPREWMPPRTSYSCTYVANWVAVKWRWHLAVDAGERTFLTHELRGCGWPRVAKPSRAAIRTGTSASTGSSGSTGSGTPAGGSSTRDVVGYAVHPGAFCSEHGSYGYTSGGTLMRCTTTATDSRYRWRSA
jgi:hypothetical protein